MPEAFKSNKESTDENVRQIESQQNDILDDYSVEETETNLTVIEKCKDATRHVNLANAAYKRLLSENAATISFLSNEYERFDSELSACMQIENRGECIYAE